MKIRIIYRVHGVADTVLQPGQVVELEEEHALTLIQSGAAVEVGAQDSLSAGDKNHTLQALRQTQEQRDAAEKEAFALRDEKTSLEKQVAALKAALKKAKATPPANSANSANGKGAA